MFTSNRATCLFYSLNIGQSILKFFMTLRSLTVRMSMHMSLPKALNCNILDIGLRSSVTPATLRVGHTGNRSDQEHGSSRTRHHSDVYRSSRRDSNIHRNTIPLRHADLGEHSPASMIRHRPARSRSSSYDSVSPRRHSRSPSRSRG